MPPNRRKVKSVARNRPADGLERGRDFQGEAEMVRSALHRLIELRIIETHSPQSSSSFNMLGEFDFSDEKLQDTISVLPPKKQTDIIPENWEAPNR